MARRTTAIITGDIVSSRKVAAGLWLRPLRQVLKRWGSAPRQFEIFRGDSFQVEIKDPAEALGAAVLIKAAIKTVKGIDVRIAIGVGSQTHRAARITESNGTAFVQSGTLLAQLSATKTRMAVATGDPELDGELNLMLRLALLVMDNWTVNAAVTIKTVLQNPGKSQLQVGKMLKVRQNTVSTRLKRAHFEEIRLLLAYYQEKMRKRR